MACTGFAWSRSWEVSRAFDDLSSAVSASNAKLSKGVLKPPYGQVSTAGEQEVVLDI